MNDWSPHSYLRFAAERTRPARDLVARVPLGHPRLVYDLGCGPGNSTEVLIEAFPQAEVIGIDKSPAMLEQARVACPSAAFEQADLAHWLPERRADLLFSNATFQWLPDHVPLLQRLIGHLEPGGVLALQMPDNLDEPSHRLMEEVAWEGPWRETLADAAAARAALPSPAAYYDALRPLAERLDLWHTIYHHPLDGVKGIVQWLMATGLKPYLDPLDEAARQGFLAAYEAELALAYPAAADGTVLLRFPRLFIVAQL